MIDEAKIEKFIQDQKKKKIIKQSVLDKYYDLIEKLYIQEQIPRSKVYIFLKSQDESIGNIQNFYKYINRRFPNSNESLQEQKEIKSIESIEEEIKE